MHKTIGRLSVAIAALVLLSGPAMADFEGMPDGEEGYAALVQLWDDFLDWREQDSPDYSADAMNDRLHHAGRPRSSPPDRSRY